MIPGERNWRELPLWVLYPLFFVGVYLSHATLLRLPYFWDEAGYYIPAALDFFKTGSLIPYTTITNAHPPLPSVMLAAWWHFAGYVPSATRTLVAMIAAGALLAVFRTARMFAGTAVAAITVILTAAYPIWFSQSTLAHADIFAALFTLWGLSFYLEGLVKPRQRIALYTALLLSLAALAKETAIITPAALATWEIVRWLRTRQPRISWLAALAFPVVPLLCWYLYHRHKTGFMFGNPEFLRYNATSTMDPRRIALSFYHRLLHLLTHMNMWVASVMTIAAALMPPQKEARRIPRAVVIAVLVVLAANLVEYSVLGGALLTRYLLPCFPLLLMLYVSVWKSNFKQWWAMALLSFAGFTAAIFINPPYAFAPEDNLTYRDFVELHQQAINVVTTRYPETKVLTAWPAWAEMMHPELGYVKKPVSITPVQNFSLEQLQLAAAEPEKYDTALLFSTKYEPQAGKVNLGKPMEGQATKYFDFHRDLQPEEAAALLHGKVVWKTQRGNEWAAVLRFPRIVDASQSGSHQSKHL